MVADRRNILQQLLRPEQKPDRASRAAIQIRNSHEALLARHGLGHQIALSLASVVSVPEQIDIGNRLVGAGSVVVVDEIYRKTQDGQRLWNTGDRRLTVSMFAEMAHELCERNGVAFESQNAPRC